MTDINPTIIFQARCEARAYLWSACMFDLHEAVDVLQSSAMNTGLVADVGQDRIQEIMSCAFGRSKGETC